MYVLEFIFATIFIFCCYESLKKFINKKIAVVIEETDIIDVEYPSVRFVENLFKSLLGKGSKKGFFKNFGV